MAGKAAEIIKYGEEGVSSGPVGDIQQASSLARAMVMSWGMSDVIGNIDYSEAHEGYNGSTGGFSVSAETKMKIEQEVKALIDEGYDTARRILLEQNDAFEALAQGLLEYETLTGEQIGSVIAGLPLAAVDDGMGQGPSAGGGGDVLAVPKTRARKPKADPSPEPSA
jgi:cell division protease FtsH